MKKTLVFGASLKENRFSYQAATRLRENGMETLGFGLVAGDIQGIRITTQMPTENDFHTITIYMNPGRQKMYYESIIDLRPQRVIFNPGTENPEFYNLLVEDSIFFEEACTLTLLAIGQY
ncbi:MAG: CoA-binding protein [Flavobacteriaceae bacterium]